MPHRRLPRSDIQRFQALKAANDEVTRLGEGTTLAISPETKTKLDAVWPQFRNEYNEREQALGTQTAATTAMTTAGQTLRQAVKHMITVLNMAIERGKLPPEERSFFQISPNDSNLPDMASRPNLLHWATAVVQGEQARIDGGRPALAWPDLAEVSEALTAYEAAIETAKAGQDQYNKEQEDVEALRDAADDCILDVWDDVEFAYRRDAPSSRRQKARSYGVVYVADAGEDVDPGDESITPASDTDDS